MSGGSGARDPVPASRECPGPVLPARGGERGQNRLPQERAAGRNEVSQRRLRSGAAARRAPLSAGRLREEPRPLLPSNQGAPARPERKALWDGGGKRGGRWVAEATGGAAAGAGPDPAGSGREGGSTGRERPRRSGKRLGAELGERELRCRRGRLLVTSR